MEGDEPFRILKREIMRRIRRDVGLYREDYLRRRIQSRAAAVGDRTLTGYLLRVRSDPGELDRLLDYMSVNVTGFFRDRTTFEAIRTQVLPALARLRRKVRALSAGCSTGQEPYSLAILMAEHLRGPSGFAVQATDIAGEALAAARRGWYGPEDVERLDRDLLARYFVPDGVGWRVGEALRGRVHFLRHDLLGDPFHGHFDIILCRNVIIYMGAEARERVLEKLTAALAPGGFLVTGRSEVLLRDWLERLATVNAAEHIYLSAEDEEE